MDCAHGRSVFYFIVCVFVVSLGLVNGDCGALPPVTNGVAANNPAFTVGSKVVYTCNAGYEFPTESSDTYTIECKVGDTWSATVLACQKVNCPVLPKDAATLSTTANVFGSKVKITCMDDTEYRIPGMPAGDSLTVECLANKTWDKWDSAKNFNACIPIICVYPMDPNAKSPTIVSTMNTLATYTCNNGFFFDDGTKTKDFRCTTQGLWVVGTRSNYTCIPNECPDLITEYKLKNVALTPKTHFISEKIKIACIDGHEFNDSSVEKYSTCQTNKTWNFEPFDCEARLCPPVFNISYCNISTFDNWYPTIVNFSCVAGYFFPDGNTWRVSKCNKYGKWSEVIPQCGDTLLEIETNFKPILVDVDGAQSVGIIAMSIIGVFLALIVILDIVTFGKQIGFLKRNLMARCKCLQPDEDDLESLDGDELMRASTISMGRGRITPAASTVDLQYGDKSKQSQLNTLEDVEALGEELRKTEIAGKKNLIPRTRLASAKSSIQRALMTAANVDLFRVSMMTSVKRKHEFASTGLPLGADNYGKVIELRPPSPIREPEPESSGSEYTDDDSDDEEEV